MQEKIKLFDKMLVESTPTIGNDEILKVSGELASLVLKVKECDFSDEMNSMAENVLTTFDEFAQELQTLTPEYMDANLDNGQELPNEVYESKNSDYYDIDDKTQKIINKLVSEEVIAHDFYIACTVASDKDVSREFSKMFISTAADEMDDHCKSICQWALDNGYRVPFKYKEYNKYASKDMIKQLNALKSKQDAKYYVEEAIKSENDAIESYEEAMKYDGLPYELHTIFMKNYYDEQQHLDDLQTLLTAVDANAHLTWY